MLRNCPYFHDALYFKLATRSQTKTVWVSAVIFKSVVFYYLFIYIYGWNVLKLLQSASVRNNKLYVVSGLYMNTCSTKKYWIICKNVSEICISIQNLLDLKVFSIHESVVLFVII